MDSDQLAAKSLTDLDLLFLRRTTEYATLMRHAVDFNYAVPIAVYHEFISDLLYLIREYRLRVPAYEEHM